MSAITTHVLDTARGRPATGVPVLLEGWIPEQGWKILGRGTTDADGRCRDLVRDATVAEGLHRLSFDTAAYFRTQGVATYFPEVVVVFQIDGVSDHHHVPLLLAPFGYTTYRGS